MINIARKKPVEVEVCQWTGKNWNEIKEFCGDVVYKHSLESIENVYGSIKIYDLMIHTLEGDHKANPGDYIIKGVHGEFYPCKPDIFHETYDILSEDTYWLPVDKKYDAFDCPNCDAMVQRPTNYCPKCGTRIEFIRLIQDGTIISLEDYKAKQPSLV